MTMIRKALLGLFALAAVMPFAGGAQAAEPAQKVFFVVTSAEAETRGMAMILAAQALKRGAEVRVLLCGPGGELAVPTTNSPAMAPFGKSPRDLMKGLIGQGVTVEVCGLFLPNRPLGPQDLLDGVKPVKPPVISEYMLDPDVRYFTF